MINRYLLFLVMLSSHICFSASGNDEASEPIQAKSLKVLPMAPQTRDGFDGKPQVSFSPPTKQNFSAQMLKKVISKKTVAKPVQSGKRTPTKGAKKNQKTKRRVNKK